MTKIFLAIAFVTMLATPTLAAGPCYAPSCMDSETQRMQRGYDARQQQLIDEKRQYQQTHQRDRHGSTIFYGNSSNTTVCSREDHCVRRNR
jgi:Ni/Co efflux regulator RcnB